MRNKEYRVSAQWDPDALVWVAESEDIPGLVTEASTMEALQNKLRILIPELLSLNGKKSIVNKGMLFLPPGKGRL